jgi:DNA-binding MarR family transcriptional regulator
MSLKAQPKLPTGVRAPSTITIVVVHALMLGRPGIDPGTLSLMRADPIAESHRQGVAHGWPEAADGMAMVTSLARVQQLLMERIDAVLRPIDLTFARYEVLRLLSFSRSGSMPMTRLGSLLQVHPTSVTSAVDRLEARGLVERLRREQDRRVILASITEDGIRVVERATERLNRTVFEQPGLSPGQVVDLTDLLGTMRAHGGDHVAMPAT